MYNVDQWEETSIALKKARSFEEGLPVGWAGVNTLERYLWIDGRGSQAKVLEWIEVNFSEKDYVIKYFFNSYKLIVQLTVASDIFKATSSLGD